MTDPSSSSSIPLQPPPGPHGVHARLTPIFDQSAYPRSEDPIAFFLLEARVQGAAQEVARAQAADLCLVLDVSGSMDCADRYPLLRRALEELVQRLSPDDRVSVVLFSVAAQAVQGLVRADDLQANLPGLLLSMDSSPLLFGGGTHLGPGLSAALELLAVDDEPDRAQRIYVLTDGELHDTDRCQGLLPTCRARGVEVNIYGFGSGFHSRSLRQLVSDQLGGSVKPICAEQDIVPVFGHIAEVSRRLVALEGVLEIELDPLVDCGDAWTFRPQERYLGRIQQRRVVRELGALEAGRTYAMLLEVRLPPCEEASTLVGRATLRWKQGGVPGSFSAELCAPRCGVHEPWVPRPEVARAHTVLDALRREGDRGAELAALRARRELALLEQRDPGLIRSLDRTIDLMEGREAAPLDEEERQYLDADQSSMVYPAFGCLAGDDDDDQAP